VIVPDFASLGEFPAFPSVVPEDATFVTGLTKREYFAAAALQGLLGYRNLTGKHDAIAENAVDFADALIEALEAFA